jgi:hypothetical protein
MKIAVLLLADAKQIMLMPENDHEKSALKLIAPHDSIEAVSKWGAFDRSQEVYGFDVFECQGGYYRREVDNDALMLIVKSEKEKPGK